MFGKGPRPIGRCSIHPARPLRRPLAGPHKVIYASPYEEGIDSIERRAAAFFSPPETFFSPFFPPDFFFFFQERKRRIRFSLSLLSLSPNFRTCECTSRLFSETAATCKDLGGKQYGRLTNGHKLRNRVRGYEPLRRISVMPITIQWVPWLPHSLSPKKQWSRSSAFPAPATRVVRCRRNGTRQSRP